MTEIETSVLEEIRRIARHDLGFSGAVEATHSLQGDLQLDSMGTLVVAVGLENRFRLKLREEDAGELATVGDLVTLVCQRLSEQEVRA